MSKNRSNTFWLSYSDLMTSLFFIMLVLFIVCVVKMKGINTQFDKELANKFIKFVKSNRITIDEILKI